MKIQTAKLIESGVHKLTLYLALIMCAVSPLVGAHQLDQEFGVHAHAEIEEIEVENNSEAMSAEEAFMADALIVANAQGWDINDTIQHLEEQQLFADIAEEILNSYPDSYMSAAYASAPGEQSMINFKGDVPADAEETINQAGLDIVVNGGYKYSENELRIKAQQVIEALSESGYEQVVVAILADGKINVSLGYQQSPDVVLDLPAELLEDVSVEALQGSVVELEHSRGGAYLTIRDVSNGQTCTNGMYRGRCTSGFSVQSIFTNTTGIATAGHCSAANHYDMGIFGNDYCIFGAAKHIGPLGDFAWMTTPHFEPAEYYATSTQLRQVNSVENFFVNGGIYCVYGRTSVTRTCERVYSTWMFSFSEGSFIFRLIAMENRVTLPGDSGGPWSFGTEAAGIHHGSVWVWGMRSVFSRADLLPQAVGARVRTQ